MHKTTLNLDKAVFMRLRNRASKEKISISELVNRLLREAMEQGSEGSPFVSHGAGRSGLGDLGENADNYIAETLK